MFDSHKEGFFSNLRPWKGPKKVYRVGIEDSLERNAQRSPISDKGLKILTFFAASDVFPNVPMDLRPPISVGNELH